MDLLHGLLHGASLTDEEARAASKAAGFDVEKDATWGEWTSAVKEATGRKGKGLFMPLRKALTGQASGPEMADVMPLLQVVKARG